jgi:FkbM family methyltransferase
VGANIGAWAGPASRSFHTVHAFEPDAAIAGTLRRVVPANVTVHEIALSDHEGIGRFTTPIHRGHPLATRASLEADANRGYEEIVCEVRLSTLDKMNLRGVDVVKIDVEGHEEAVLAGASETIARERPTLIVEIEERHHAGRSELIVESLLSRDYSCHYLLNGKLIRFRLGSIGNLQPPDLVPTPEVKSERYINNFIFIPGERKNERESIERFLTLQSGNQ